MRAQMIKTTAFVLVAALTLLLMPGAASGSSRAESVSGTLRGYQTTEAKPGQAVDGEAEEKPSS